MLCVCTLFSCCCRCLGFYTCVFVCSPTNVISDKFGNRTTKSSHELKTAFHPLFKTMLATRASTRNASRIARSFATVVDTAGVKVAAVDYGQPTSAVTFLVKAGSRFESKPGVAHALKNFAFKVRNAYM